MPVLSVIICAYNAADTLKKAALSVLSQSFRDLELIIVNDGSTDSTLKVALKIAEQDKRVKVIDTQNGGVAKARNLSLSVANGDFITFCDADDYIDDGAFETMYNAVMESCSDMLIAGYFHETETKKGVKRVEISAENAVYSSKQELYEDFFELKSKYLIDAMCNKLFRRSVIVQNGLKFPEGELFEDTDFNLRFLEITPRLNVLNRCFYHYIQYSGAGITRKFEPKKAKYLTDRYHLMLQFCSDADDELKGYCYLYHIRNMFSFISGTYGVKEMKCKERTDVIKSIIFDSDFDKCIKNAKASSFAGKCCLAVAKKQSVLLTKAFCRVVYYLKRSATTIFTRFKR